ncbi:MAG TPA: hypothetical protein VMV27_14380 [Candidatus Binataceae bacterium]|nr:hypothetical protein [Candidatus Binataceae bacterium]
MASVAANPALLERAPYPDGGLPRMPAALLALWIRARDAFPHPTVAAAVQVLIGPTDQFSPAAVCMDVEHLVATLWIVRAALWRIALAQAHHDPRPFAIGVPSADMVASRDRISVGANGRITIEHRDISAALLAILGELNLERLRICRARYRRTRSTCSRLFLALRKDQKDCSRQCADLRRHNDVRHPSAKPECVKCGRVWSADRLWVCNFSDCPNGGN